jgi:hypothetical protein
VNPGKIAYAQANVTATFDADGLIKILKAKHPILAALTGDENRDLVIKIIKGLDAKEAVKASIALNIIRQLQQYKAIDEVP